jgi:hypothetical protein
VAYFPICHLRHVFCTRLSWVAPDAVVQRALRHSSPATKRHFQLGMVEQVRQNLEKANEKVVRQPRGIHFYDSQPATENRTYRGDLYHRGKPDSRLEHIPSCWWEPAKQALERKPDASGKILEARLRAQIVPNHWPEVRFEEVGL